MAKKSKSEAFHDRYANVYDSRYSGSPYWEIYDAVTWQHLRRFLPTDLGAHVLDAGCGTGKWGLRLAKSGYHVTLSDLSQKMLDQAVRKAEDMGLSERVTFHKADLATLDGLDDGAFGFVLAQGDPLCCVERPGRAVKAIARVTQPGGVLVASVDNRWAGIDHYMPTGDLAALERFLKTGQTQWLAADKANRFAMHMFWPNELSAALDMHGFEVLDVLGKTVLVSRHTPREMIADPATQKRLVKLELQYGRKPEALGRAAHFQIVARKQS